MKTFSVRPTLTLKGRTFKGLRGFSGKPSHPPLTDIPIGAYLIVAGMDVLSYVGGASHGWAGELWRIGGWIMVVGLAGALLAALTGYVDARSSSEAGTQARRTINTHAAIMIVVTVLAAIDVAARLSGYHDHSATPLWLMVLSVVVALLVALGATFGGSLVFEYGFNVETAGDHPAWHRSEDDVLPGQHD
ncbi:MAG: DUF2231 domain-containing protein [Actinobacteria bacterium]|nr:DUF2231 domain-containing protein [Actinomycetota bacterium]